jgi:hypothetical protein
MSEPHWIRFLSVCGKLPARCNPHKDQVLGAWWSEPKIHEGLVSFIVQEFWEVVWVFGCTFLGTYV